MQTDRPRFRQDLVAEPLEDGGSKFIDVMDPDSGVLFRFYEVEYSLACAMDGQRDVAGIVRWAEEELGLKASQNEVKTVIATLGDLGYLEGGAAAAAATAAAAKPAAAATPPAKRPATPPAGTPVAKTNTPAGGLKKQPEQPVLNRWDAPTSMGDADEYLAQGVVAGGAKTPQPSAGDVELGAPGARGVEVRADALPNAPELELGAPGSRTGAKPAAAKGADIALGSPGRTDVSVDLADHVDLDANAVKEAVRSSQVMKAVDVPPELAAEVESKPAAKPAAKVEEKPAAKPAAKPAEKPAAKPVEKRPSVAPVAPRQGVSPVLLAALIIAILAAGGFALYKFVLKKDSTESTSKVTPPPPVKPEPPAPPPVETQKLATEQPAPEELKPTDAHQLAWIAANDTVVKAGDPVAKYVGFKSLEADVKTVTTALDKAKADVAAAGADEKKLAAAQKAQADIEKKLADKQGALDKFLLKAPAAGKVTAVAKLNAKVTPTDVVATLQRDAILVATFKKADGATENAPVLLAVKGTEQKLACNVVMASGDGTKIACPSGAAAEGTEVSFAGLDSSRPAGGETPPTPPTPPEGAGSATPEAGSGAGSAGPDQGSDGAGKGAAEEKAVKAPAPVRRPVRRPVQRPAGQGDKAAGSAAPAGGEKPAGGETPPATPPPAPAPAPAPAGSNSL
jgi:hypothetical protein